MIQDPNPTDYPHLEAFIDWMYDHVKELPADVETLKARIQRAASNPQEQAATTAKTLTEEERETATAEWFDGLADTPYHLRDEGTVDGEGESYAARNL